MMRFCEHCFSSLDQDDQFCPECGATTSSEPAAEGSDALIYPELARANLLRLRGNSQAAEKLLLTVLKRFPSNSTSQILMGDIYAERADHHQALQWYRMAKDLAPNSPGLDEKIERANREIHAEESKIGTAGLEVSTSRVPIVVIALIAGIILIVSASAFYIAGLRASRAELERLDKISKPITINNPPAPSAPSNDHRPPAPQTSGPSSPMTQEEAELIQAMIRTNPDLQHPLAAAALDPRTSSALITALQMPDRDPAQLAASIGAAALSASPSLARVEIHILDADQRRLVLAGTVKAESLSKAQGEPGTPEWASSVLTEVWRP
jgi:hypothetical protein